MRINRVQFGAALFMKAPIDSVATARKKRDEGAKPDMLSQAATRFLRGVVVPGGDVISIIIPEKPNADPRQKEANELALRLFARENDDVPAILNPAISSETSAFIRSQRLKENWAPEGDEKILNPFRA